MLIQDIALKTSWEQWMIETGGERGSGKSVLAVQHDDDDEFKNCVNFYDIHYIFLYFDIFLG